MSGLANRGKGLESALDMLHQVYEAQRKASVIRSPTNYKVIRPGVKSPELVVVPDALSAPDYHIQAQGRSLLLDAKECHATRWQLSHLPEHQADRFTRHERQGGCAFVLLQFVGKTFLLPWNECPGKVTLHSMWTAWQLDLAKRGRASLTPEDCAVVGYPLTSIDYLAVALLHARTKLI